MVEKRFSSLFPVNHVFFAELDTSFFNSLSSPDVRSRHLPVGKSSLTCIMRIRISFFHLEAKVFAHPSDLPV